jgi:hypothetical protein
MERVCRLCLASETDREFERIYGNQNQKIALKIFLISQIKIIEFDDSIALICLQCVKELYQCFLFRKKIQNSDEFFRNKFDEANIFGAYNEDINDSKQETIDNIEEIINESQEELLSELKIVKYQDPEDINENLKIEALDSSGVNELECEYEALEELDEDIQENDTDELQITEEQPTKVISPPPARRGRKLKRQKRPYNRLACKICGITLSRRQRLIQHERLHYLESTKLYYECDLCGKQFNQRFSIIPHFQKHHNFKSGPNERWKCAICEDKTMQAGKMEVHYRKFHSEFYNENDPQQAPRKSPYKSAQKVKKPRQKKIKSEENKIKDWFVCSLCGNSFTCNYRYQKHLNDIHGVAEHEINQKEETLIVQELKRSKNVPCQVCGKPFASLATCKAHEKTHLNLQFLCDLCGKGFKIKVTSGQ